MAQKIARIIDLNHADEQDIEQAFQIGRERARRLIENRPFRSWDEVKSVPGFSQSLVDDLRRAGADLGPEEEEED